MYKQEIEGRGCIRARIVADSVASNSGTRITTFELEYPRFIHSELMTHRMFSRNAMSSRAVPIAKMIEQVRTNPAMPVVWGKNQSGMQAKENLSGYSLEAAKIEWEMAAESAAVYASELETRNVHKQIVNRLLEPFQIMKTVVTATEWNNWWYLRDHEDAQPEIAELAKVMHQIYEQNEPDELKPGEWHVPYVGTLVDAEGNTMYCIWPDDPHGFIRFLKLDEALKVSSSCCAQVSFRLNDNSVEKAIGIYGKLVESKPVHASPFEHQGTPMVFWEDDVVGCTWQEGTTHLDSNRSLWSGNLKHWVQHRQLIKDHVVRG